jgi:hypothetical protein
MSSLTEHAKHELELAKLFDDTSDYNGTLGYAVMELIETFSKQEHSGFSANMAINIFTKLAKYETITPLTLQDDEFNDNGQNKRMSSVFKDSKTGRCFYIHAFYMRNQNGVTYSGSLIIGDGRFVKRCYIKDPNNMPKICIDIIDWEVDRITNEPKVGTGWWESKMKDVTQLAELEKYYELDIQTE